MRRRRIVNDIEQIASVHLGKAGDGSVVKPYVTPDYIDSSLLVPIPRYLNRTQYNIDDSNLPFVGVDTWNSYEFSCLLNNGFPISGWLRWSYYSDTPNIIESKSVKLYLNSFNMVKMGSTIKEAIDALEERIVEDFTNACGGNVTVRLFTVYKNEKSVEPMTGDFIQLEQACNVEQIEFTAYNEDSSILEVVPSNSIVHLYKSNSLRSNCRVTNQPDWGDVYIHIKGNYTVTPESILQYIVSMRKENHFHEEICECIYKRLWDLLQPEELVVTCLYTRRGGIDINPIRASNNALLRQHSISYAYSLTDKTMRQ
jgi:7-cyano-7-deazaguanine reductase